jgi:pantoate--beta-alanine ligase
MFIVHTVSEIQQLVKLAREQKKTIGFVPTMGALHLGHLSLVRASKKQYDITIVSIFVNPTQFNNPEDLKKYPRTIRHDKASLHALHVNILFCPGEKEIYPEPDTRHFDFGTLDKVMEGKYRPGHFNGVAQVVSKLLTIVQPDAMFLGEKDLQQLAIVRSLVQQMGIPTTVVACPTVREEDGLAMSSRNALLTEPQRAHAPIIAATLHAARDKGTLLPVDELQQWVSKTIDEDRELEVEYVEIVDEQTLQPVKNWCDSRHIRLCVAVYAHPVRLIDNIQLK